MVLEYCGGGSAWDLVDDMLFQMKEEHVATILKSVLTALVYLEEHGILHRDIKVPCLCYRIRTTHAVCAPTDIITSIALPWPKPDNILFTADGHVKLSTCRIPQCVCFFFPTSNNSTLEHTQPTSGAAEC